MKFSIAFVSSLIVIAIVYAVISKFVINGLYGNKYTSEEVKLSFTDYLNHFLSLIPITNFDTTFYPLNKLSKIIEFFFKILIIIMMLLIFVGSNSTDSSILLTN